jgi:hypothetical protein
VRSGIEDVGVDNDAEEPGCVGEVGTHLRAWRAEEVGED